MNVLDIQLPQLSGASVRFKNALIANTLNHVYGIGEMNLFLRATDKKPEQAVRVDIRYLGQACCLYVDLAMINTLLAPHALKLEDMSADAVQLYLLQHVQKMPKNIHVINMCIDNQHICTHHFEVMSYDNGQSSNWVISFDAGDNFPLKHLMEAMRPLLKGVMAHQWQQLPISLPLVVSAVNLPMEDISTLAIGDVLFLEG